MSLDRLAPAIGKTVPKGKTNPGGHPKGSRQVATYQRLNRMQGTSARTAHRYAEANPRQEPGGIWMAESGGRTSTATVTKNGRHGWERFR